VELQIFETWITNWKRSSVSRCRAPARHVCAPVSAVHVASSWSSGVRATSRPSWWTVVLSWALRLIHLPCAAPRATATAWPRAQAATRWRMRRRGRAPCMQAATWPGSASRDPASSSYPSCAPSSILTQDRAGVDRFCPSSTFRWLPLSFREPPRAALPHCSFSSRPNHPTPFLAPPSAPPSRLRPRRHRSTAGCSGHAGAACRRLWAPPSPVRPRPSTTLARLVKPLAHSSGQVRRPPTGNSGRRWGQSAPGVALQSLSSSQGVFSKPGTYSWSLSLSWGSLCKSTLGFRLELQKSIKIVEKSWKHKSNFVVFLV
jgi:hypothetical protein